MKKLLFFVLSFCLIADFCHKQTKGFAIQKILSPLPIDIQWEPKTEEEHQAIASLLQAPFYYLKKGKSSYVFLSEDGKTVIKFFRRERIHPSFWDRLPLPSCQKNALEKETLQQVHFASYQMAQEKIPLQTQVLYAHLGKTHTLHSTITLYDPLGIKHLLPANEVEFILQKKADPFCPYFEHLLKTNQRDSAKKLLGQFARFLQERACLGIEDKDLSPRYNLGVLEGHLVTFDLDSLRKKELTDVTQHMLKDAKKMLTWLTSKDPSLALFLQEELQALAWLSKDPGKEPLLP